MKERLARALSIQSMLEALVSHQSEQDKNKDKSPSDILQADITKFTAKQLFKQFGDALFAGTREGHAESLC